MMNERWVLAGVEDTRKQCQSSARVQMVCLRCISSWYVIPAGGSNQRLQLNLRPLSDLPAAVRQLPALALLSRLVSQEGDQQPGIEPSKESSSSSTAAVPRQRGAQPQRASAKPAGREAAPAASSGPGSVAAAARSWGGALVGGVLGVLQRASGQAGRDSQPIAKAAQHRPVAQNAGERAKPPASPSTAQVRPVCFLATAGVASQAERCLSLLVLQKSTAKAPTSCCKPGVVNSLLQGTVMF